MEIISHECGTSAALILTALILTVAAATTRRNVDEQSSISG